MPDVRTTNNAPTGDDGATASSGGTGTDDDAKASAAKAEAKADAKADAKASRSVIKNADGSPVVDFLTFSDAEAQAKAIGGKAHVEHIGVAFHVATDAD